MSITGKYPYHAALQSMKIGMQTIRQNGPKLLFYFLGHESETAGTFKSCSNNFLGMPLYMLFLEKDQPKMKKDLFSLKPSKYSLIIIEILGSQDLRIGPIGCTNRRIILSKF